MKRFFYSMAWAVGILIGIPCAAIAAPFVLIAKGCKSLCVWSDHMIERLPEEGR